MTRKSLTLWMEDSPRFKVVTAEALGAEGPVVFQGDAGSKCQWSDCSCWLWPIYCCCGAMFCCCGTILCHCNAKKSQILHIRHHQKKRNTTTLYCCGHRLEYVDTYKYLGYHIHEHLSHSRTVHILTNSAKRAFGKIVNAFKKTGKYGLQNIRYTI